MLLGLPLLRPSRRLIAACAALTLLVGAASLLVTPAAAQFRDVTPAHRLVSGQLVNAFIPWEGTQLGGVDVEIPSGWSLQAVRAVPEGTLVPVELALAPTGPTTFRATARAALAGPILLIARFKVGPEAEWPSVRFVPLVQTDKGWTAAESGATRWQPPVGARQRRSLGQGFQSSTPLALAPRALPPLGPDAAFTLEAWLKTTALGEVVLSTWDGREGRSYAAELTVDSRGYLVAFRGTGGRHRSLASAHPIADGLWHHVALVQQPASGLLRLLVDGTPADSLRLETGTFIRPQTVGIGGRVAEQEGRSEAFSGMLDEVRLWDEARSTQAIRRTRRRTLAEDGEQPAVQLSFEQDVPDALLGRPGPARYRTRSDLSFSFPVEHLSADVDAAVVAVTWETMDRENTAFVVERSADGRRFREVGTLRLDDRVAEAASGAMRFQLADVPPADDRVAYYRVRQRFADGPDRVSGTVKVGLGVTAGPETAILYAAPNPFSSVTTVRYTLAETGRARLSVWDVAGQQVALLFDQAQAAGEHEVTFDAGTLPSGLYFARLQTPSGADTFKLTLTR